MSHERKLSFINHEIIFLNAAELSLLMPVLGTGKFNFRNNLNTIKIIKTTNHYVMTPLHF